MKTMPTKRSQGRGGDLTAANLANGGIGNDFAPLFLMTDVTLPSTPTTGTTRYRLPC
jgi:hypothetical protein